MRGFNTRLAPGSTINGNKDRVPCLSCYLTMELECQCSIRILYDGTPCDWMGLRMSWSQPPSTMTTRLNNGEESTSPESPIPTKNTISSPLKDLLPTVAAHDRGATAKHVHSRFAMQTSFKEMWKLRGLKEEVIKNKYKGVHHPATPERFVTYLNELSHTVARFENVDGTSLQIVYAIFWVAFLSAYCSQATNTLHQRTQYCPNRSCHWNKMSPRFRCCGRTISVSSTF